MDGTFWVFLSEALVLPVGFIIAVILTRTLGPDLYGLYILSAAIILWLEWQTGRLYVRIGQQREPGFSMRRFGQYAGPLFVAAVCMRLFEKMDLYLLKILGAGTAQAGIYGAAQTGSVIFLIFALSFAPLVLSSVRSVLHSDGEQKAIKMATLALRVSLLTLPFAALLAGIAEEAVRFVYGVPYAQAGPVMQLLVFGIWGIHMVTVITAILTAAGKPLWTLVPALVILPPALAGHLFFIPRFGMQGAAAVTAVMGFLAAVISLLCLRRTWKLSLQLHTYLGAGLTSLLVYFIAQLLPGDGVWIILKGFGLFVFVPMVYYITGIVKRNEISALRILFNTRAKQNG